LSRPVTPEELELLLEELLLDEELDELEELLELDELLLDELLDEELDELEDELLDEEVLVDDEDELEPLPVFTVTKKACVLCAPQSLV
jgi:hypothetical protein